MNELKKLQAQQTKIQQKIAAIEQWEKRKTSLLSVLDKAGAAALTDSEILAAIKAAAGAKKQAQPTAATASPA